MVGDCKAHYTPVGPSAWRATTEPPAGWCQVGRVLSPRPAEEGAVRGAGRGPTRKPPRGLCSPLAGEAPGRPSPWACRGLLPPAPRGPWVSVATAGARPGGGQPGWGRGAPGASAAAWPCSPAWPPCSPSRCPPRCRGETRVKYLRAAFPPLSLVGQLAPPGPPARAPCGVLRARPTSVSIPVTGVCRSPALEKGLAGFAWWDFADPCPWPGHFSGPEFPLSIPSQPTNVPESLLCSRQKESRRW